MIDYMGLHLSSSIVLFQPQSHLNHTSFSICQLRAVQVVFVLLICSSGVPTGNGELAKSELVGRTNNFGLWPIVLLWPAAIINGITLIYPQFLQVRNFKNISTS